MMNLTNIYTITDVRHLLTGITDTCVIVPNLSSTYISLFFYAGLYDHKILTRHVSSIDRNNNNFVEVQV